MEIDRHFELAVDIGFCSGKQGHELPVEYIFLRLLASFTKSAVKDDNREPKEEQHQHTDREQKSGAER